MSSRKYKSFKEFYPYYLSEHEKRGTRITHFIGTTFFFIFLALAIFQASWIWLIASVVTPYAWAWIGHFFIEKNQPATFQYPLWSLASDFKLYFQILSGKESFGKN